MAVDKFVLDQSELFALAQRFESLAKQNAQKARRIADLEAELARAQATKHEPIRPIIEFVKDEKEALIKSNISDEYKNFTDEHEERLDKEFGEKHDFQTSVRGIKVRGCFPTQQEAELRCKMLRQNDPNHDVYVGPVGIWVPFHPEAYKTGRVEYMEETLNELMSEKKKNEEKAKDEFDNRVKEAKVKAMEDNKKKAEETGAKLTQTINAEGDLVSVANMNTQESAMGENATLDDVKKELFEGENIVTDKNTDHGLTQVEGGSDSTNA